MTKKIDDRQMCFRVSHFLADLDIALGHVRQAQGSVLLPEFKVQLRQDDVPVHEQLAAAFRRLPRIAQDAQLEVVYETQLRCASRALGLRRSLCVIDLVHEIAPGLTGAQSYEDLLLRPADADEQAVWLAELLLRWRRWRIRVEARVSAWVHTAQAMAPEALMGLAEYLVDFEVLSAPDLASVLAAIQVRVAASADQLLEFGQDPEFVANQLADWMPQLAGNETSAPAVGQPAELRVRPALQRATPAQRGAEVAWLNAPNAVDFVT